MIATQATTRRRSHWTIVFGIIDVGARTSFCPLRGIE